MATSDIKQPRVKFSTQEKLEKFMILANEKNPNTEKILNMVKNTPATPKRKK